jgi:16S rRNA (guanine(966)-N(2))-methyltransferase RsmD
MRVIAGKARRIQLNTIRGNDTRPTTDRIKETLFNMINPMLYDINFLDLFSGSGAIGIEALSRGAKKATLVEKNRAAVQCIESNLEKARLKEQAVVLCDDVFLALKKISSKGEVFDVVFLDPPYNQDLEKNVLIFLAKSDLINENSIIIVEASLETDFEYVKQLGFKITRDKQYKTNKHIFLKLSGE